jgi:hypothetical protein
MRVTEPYDQLLPAAGLAKEDEAEKTTPCKAEVGLVSQICGTAVIPQ